MSKLTDFLKLHIWEIPKDNKEKFNYVKSIAENFEKIDTGLQDAVNKFTEPLSYKGEVETKENLPDIATNGDIYNVTSENKNYIYDGTNWVEYSSTLNLVPLENNTKTTKTTDISEELTIQDSAPVGGKLDIKSGKTIQEGEPSSDNIIPIRNVGDNVNIFNKDNNPFFRGVCQDDGSYNYTNLYVISTLPYQLNKGTYTFKNYNISESNFKFYIKLFTINGSFVENRYIDGHSFTLNDKYNVVFQNNNPMGANVPVDSYIELLNEKVKLELSPISTPYTSYGCGCVNLKVENKNFIDYNSMFVQSRLNAKVIDDELIITRVAESASYISFNIGGLKIGEYYTIKCNNQIIIYKDKVYGSAYTSNTNASKGHTFRAGQENYVVAIIIGSGDIPNIGDTLNCGKIQLEEGKISTNYVPHQEQIVSFPFTEGQVLHKGDYLAEDGIHQKRKTIVLDGTETIVISQQHTNSTLFRITALASNPSKTDFIEGYCNILKFSMIWGHDKEGVYTSDKYIYLSINNSTIGTSSVEAIKAYLAEQYANGTPVIIEYELAEEIVIPYTEEQKEARYELQHLLMYEGYTNISCTDEIKPDMQLEYYFNNEINKTYAKRMDSLEEKIRLLEKAISSQSEVSN